MQEGNVFLTVVGRAEGPFPFRKIVSSCLPDNYEIDSMFPLSEEGDMGEPRYIAFIRGEEFGQHNNDWVKIRVQAEGFTAEEHDSFDDAIEYSKVEYGLEDEQAEMHERLEEMNERFPDPNAKDVERKDIFDALYKTDKLTFCVGLFDEIPATVIVKMSNYKEGEVLATPLAVLLNDELLKKIEMPWEAL